MSHYVKVCFVLFLFAKEITNELFLCSKFYERKKNFSFSIKNHLKGFADRSVKQQQLVISSKMDVIQNKEIKVQQLQKYNLTFEKAKQTLIQLSFVLKKKINEHQDLILKLQNEQMKTERVEQQLQEFEQEQNICLKNLTQEIEQLKKLINDLNDEKQCLFNQKQQEQNQREQFKLKILELENEKRENSLSLAKTKETLEQQEQILNKKIEIKEIELTQEQRRLQNIIDSLTLRIDNLEKEKIEGECVLNNTIEKLRQMESINEQNSEQFNQQIYILKAEIKEQEQKQDQNLKQLKQEKDEQQKTIEVEKHLMNQKLKELLVEAEELKQIKVKQKEIIEEKDLQIQKLTQQVLKQESESLQRITDIEKLQNSLLEQKKEHKSIQDQNTTNLTIIKQQEHQLNQQKINEENYKRQILAFENQLSQKPKEIQFAVKPSTPANYQLIEQNSISQSEYCWAIAVNEKKTVMVAGCGSKITVFRFEGGKLNQTQVLSDHSGNIRSLCFMKKFNQFISGGDDKTVRIWCTQDNQQWQCQQILKEGHSNTVNQVIINNNENLIVSCSWDFSIKFWRKEAEWNLLQTLKAHNSYVWAVSFNESENQIVSCSEDNQIMISQVNDNQWSVVQTITVEQKGYRVCFIEDYLIAFQPYRKDKLELYKINPQNRQFDKYKEIYAQNDCSENNSLFPQKFYRQQARLINKNGNRVNFFKIINGELVVEQSILFGTDYFFGTLTDDTEFLIVWDKSTISVRKQQQ